MRLNGFLLTLCLAASCLQSSKSFAQQDTAQSCDVPVVVTGYDNQLVRDLAPADFSVRLADAPKAVDSASIDGGPKRIALILDASKNVPDGEWKLETEMAASFVGHARSKDQFAFLVIGAEGTADSFLSFDDVAGRLQKMTSSRPAATEANERIYDSVLDAAHRLNPPQFGDAIFLFGHNQDSGSAASADQILDLVVKNRMRFYGMSFADPLANKPLPKGSGRSKLESLSAETGYFFSFHAAHNLNQPGQMTLFQGFLADLYAWIAEPYRLSFSSAAIRGQTKLEVTVANLETRRVHQDGIHYPHSLYPCVAPAVEKAP
ncbi:MAG: hypothetical protein LAO03_05565 [Acidobacteriia bacterium]|nr:hypothetical protein [Terriglobia bacterium]